MNNILQNKKALVIIGIIVLILAIAWVVVLVIRSQDNKATENSSNNTTKTMQQSKADSVNKEEDKEDILIDDTSVSDTPVFGNNTQKDIVNFMILFTPHLGKYTFKVAHQVQPIPDWIVFTVNLTNVPDNIHRTAVMRLVEGNLVMEVDTYATIEGSYKADQYPNLPSEVKQAMAEESKALINGGWGNE